MIEAASAEPETLPPGTVIGAKYEIVRLLGAGGMGAVYEARNSWTDRRVALKLLHPQYAKNAEVVGRFLREAKAATRIGHPNIVDVLDMGQDAEGGALFIVQEFLLGEDLGRRMGEAPPLTIREALRLVVPVMSALVAAHRQGVVHRDIKPENVFLTRGPRGGVVPKLIDFGISKVLDETGVDRSKTRTGVAIGTPQYMSPEQARGRADVDGRTDVWSVGVLLYELVAGRLPFDAPNYNLLIVAILTTPAPPIASVARDVPPALAAVIHRALEPDVADRFRTMAEFLGALLDCDLGDGAPLVAPADREAYLTGSLAPDPADAPASAPPPPAPAAPAAPLAPTEVDPAAAATDPPPGPALTPTQWQQNPSPSSAPALHPRRLAAAAAVAVLGVVALVSLGVAFGRRTAPDRATPAPVRVAAPAPVAEPEPVAEPAAAPAPVAAAPVAADAGVARPAVRPAVRPPPTARRPPPSADPLRVDEQYPGAAPP
jgi:serine/threonine-protein kinase